MPARRGAATRRRPPAALMAPPQPRRRGRQWLARHRADAFVRRARSDGYRSRSAFKLAEIDRRDRLLRAGMTVLDLGAAPGGWSQYAAQRLGGKGRIVAVDLLAMEPVPGVEFLQADIRDDDLATRVMARLGRPADLVICDMAPNITGVAVTDQARYLELLEAVLECCRAVLREGGTLLVKLFEGEQAQSFRAHCESLFTRVATRKPPASRSQSREFYLLAVGFRPARTAGA